MRWLPSRFFAILLVCVGSSLYGAPLAADTQTEQAILKRLAALEQNQRKLEEQLDAKDARIQELEQRLGQPAAANQQLQQPVTTTPVTAVPVTETTVAATAAAAPVAAQQTSGDGNEYIGRFRPGGPDASVLSSASLTPSG